MRVLVVRLRANGDVIHALPVACALKDHLPGAFVAWLAEGWASQVLVGHPAIDQLITVRGRWSWSLRDTLRLRRKLRALRLDAVLDLQGVRSSMLAALLSGAPRRLGFAGMAVHDLRRLISSADRLHVVSRMLARRLRFEPIRARSEHIVDRYLEILEPLGLNAPEVRFGLRESETDAQIVTRYLSSAGLLAQRYVVINPGGPAIRRWPPERFAAVATYLGSAHGVRSVVLPGVGAGERRAAETIAAGENRTRPSGPHSRSVNWVRWRAGRESFCPAIRGRFILPPRSERRASG